MADLLNVLEFCLDHLVEIAILIFEFIGVGIIIFSGLQWILAVSEAVTGDKADSAKGLAMGWSLRGKRDLKNGIVRDWKEIGTVAGIIALRAALTFSFTGNSKKKKRKCIKHKIKRAVIRWQKMPDGWRLLGVQM